MDAILFLIEIQKKGRKYRDVWMDILLKYAQNDSIKLIVPIGMPSTTYFRIINNGVSIFPLFLKNYSIVKDKSLLIIKPIGTDVLDHTIIETPIIIKEKKPSPTKPIKNNSTESIVVPEVITEINHIVAVSMPKAKKKEVVVMDVHIEIISYLNECTGSAYRYDTKSTINLINPLLNRGFSVDDFKHVIEVKSRKWLNTDQEIYLRPETLFGSKFESYLNEKIIIQKNIHQKAYDTVNEATDLGWNRKN